MCRTHHEEGEARPEARPARGAVRLLGRLTVKRDGRGGGFTHHTAADVLSDGGAAYRYAGNRRRGRQPVGFIVPTGVRAGPHVAGGEGHGGEDGHTRPRLT